jgi:ArsR family transcriptional regulator
VARLDEILSAAGEPTRLRILNLLRLGSICVCDLQAILGLPQPTVSRHLATLRRAGLVVDKRAGPRVVYSLAGASSPPLACLFDMLRACGPSEPELAADMRRVRGRTAARKFGGPTQKETRSRRAGDNP